MAKQTTRTGSGRIRHAAQASIPAHADYVIIGNSAAGISAAETIRAHDPAGSICMLSYEPYAAYGKPLISYLIEGKTDADHMAFRDAEFYKRLHIDCGFGAAFKVEKLDADAHKLLLAGGTEISYGVCLLACGSVPFVPKEIEGWRNRENIHAFECLDDALAVQTNALRATKEAHAFDRNSRALIVGGGLTGLKAAEALSALVDETVVLTHGPRIMSKVLDDAASDLLIDLLNARGVHVMKNITVQSFEGTVGHCSQATLSDESIFAFDVAVTAVGVRPASGLAKDAGARIERGIVIDETMETTLKDVFAAGDVAQAIDIFSGSARPLALWTNAVRQGKIAGAHMAKFPHAPVYGPDYAENIVDFFDISVMTCGIVNPEPDKGYEETVFAQESAYAKFVTRNGLLAGYVLVNLPDACGIYNALIGQAVPLSNMNTELFCRPPRNMDFSEDARWERLHKGYPSALDQQGFCTETFPGRV